MNPYDFAIQMSRDGEKFFRTLGKQVKKPGLRKILVMLANDQAIPRRDFEKMKKAEGKTLPDAKNLTEALNPFAQRLKRMGRGERLDENLPPEELYRRGQELDKECENLMIALYDLKDDPLEDHNLAADPAHAETLRTLHGSLLEVMRADGDPLVAHWPAVP